MSHKKSITRKRKILIESKDNPSISLPTSLKESVEKNKGIFAYTFNEYNPQRNNRFIVELMDAEENLLVDSSKINSFKFSQDKQNNSFLVIDSFLEEGEWIDKFLEAKICKLFLLNAVGKVVNYLDYDITNSGYEYQLNYLEDEVLCPKFFFTIL